MHTTPTRVRNPVAIIVCRLAEHAARSLVGADVWPFLAPCLPSLNVKLNKGFAPLSNPILSARLWAPGWCTPV